MCKKNFILVISVLVLISGIAFPQTTDPTVQKVLEEVRATVDTVDQMFDAAQAKWKAYADSVAKIPDVIVEFDDPNLESVIREALEKPTGKIIQKDMWTLSEIKAESKGIKSLKALEHAINLETLTIPGNSVSDLSSLSNCKELSWLDIANNQVSKLCPLDKCEKISTVMIVGNPIESINALSGKQDLGLVMLSLPINADLKPFLDFPGGEYGLPLHLSCKLSKEKADKAKIKEQLKILKEGAHLSVTKFK